MKCRFDSGVRKPSLLNKVRLYIVGNARALTRHGPTDLRSCAETRRADPPRDGSALTAAQFARDINTCAFTIAARGFIEATVSGEELAAMVETLTRRG